HAAAVSLSLYQRNEISTTIVNRACGSEIHTGLAFFRIAGSGEYAVATRMHQLNRGGANTAAAAMHEERLARLQSGGVEHIAPDGEIDLRQSAGVLQRHSGRDLKGAQSRRDRIFGITATAQKRANAVAFPTSRHTPAHCHHRPR